MTMLKEGLNTIHIHAILAHDCMTKDLFQGVFPVNKLPKWKPGAYVINTDKHNECYMGCLLREGVENVVDKV